MTEDTDTVKIAEIKKSKRENSKLTITFTQIGTGTFLKMKGLIGQENIVETTIAGNKPSQLDINLELNKTLEKLSELNLDIDINQEQDWIEVKQPMYTFIEDTHEG